MIEVKGQYIFSASVDGFPDFLTVRDLVYFRVEETCGNVPASFIFQFFTREDEIVTKLNDAYPIQIQFGESLEDYEGIELYASNFKHRPESDRILISLEGFCIEPDFNIASKIRSFKNMSGLSALREASNGLLNPKFNVQESQDSQTWLQYNLADRQFFNQVLSHSYSADSFFLSAIRANKDYIVKDAVLESSLKSDQADWVFDNLAVSANAIPYGGEYEVDVQTGILNNLVGYGREKILYEIESGNESFLNMLPKPVVALTRDLAKKSSIDHKFTGPSFLNENVHDNYQKAYLNFLINNILLGSITIELSFKSLFRDVAPLDWVMFKAPSKNVRGASNEYVSGFYIVSSSVKEIRDSELRTSVRLNRESFNLIRNA